MIAFITKRKTEKGLFKTPDCFVKISGVNYEITRYVCIKIYKDKKQKRLLCLDEFQRVPILVLSKKFFLTHFSQGNDRQHLKTRCLSLYFYFGLLKD